MKIELSKSKRILFYIAIMFTNVAIMGEACIIPIMSSYYENFYDNMMAANFIASGPTLVMVVVSLLTPLLCKKISRKKVTIIGTIAFAIGAIPGAWFVNIPWMIFTRCLMGIGEGMVNVGAMALIAELYIEEEKRATFMGVFNAIMAGFGAIMSALAGILAGIHWQGAYDVYWAAIVMIILACLFLPNIKSEKNTETQTEETLISKNKEPYGKSFLLMHVTFWLFNLVYAMITYYLSVYVIEYQLGSTTFTGLVSAAGTVGSFLICLIFGFIYKKLGNGSPILSQILATLGMIVLCFFPSQVSALLGMLLLGISYGIFLSYAYAHGSIIVPTSKIDGAMAWATIGFALPMFVSTYFMSFLFRVLNTDSTIKIWFVGLGILVFSLIFDIIRTICEKKFQKLNNIV